MKDRGLWIIIGLFIVAGVVWGVWHSLVPQEQNRGVDNQPQPMVQATTTPQASTPSGITYTADGKIDTSDWVEYRSEYGGFSVRAPKERALISCGRGCDPTVNGEAFLYTLTNGFEEDAGLEAMTIRIIQKGSDYLNTWIDKHVASPTEYMPGIDQGVVADRQMVTINGHTALRFDVNAPAQSAVGLSTKNIAMYPNGTPQTTSQVLFNYPTVLHGRVYVVDLGNRFALVTEVLSYDKAGVETYNSNSNGGQAELLDNKTLSDVYDTILQSFESFAPTGH